jgi:prolyl oligopeptidase
MRPFKASCALLLILLSVGRIPVRSQDHPLRYPVTAKTGQADTLFGIRVADPYRWLEDDTSHAVARWVDKENTLTSSYLAGIPFRSRMQKRLEEMYNYPKYTAPLKKHGLYVFSKNDGLQNQAVMYIQKGRNGTPEVLLDPNTFSADGTARLVAPSFSADMTYLAYGISRAGSDWIEGYVMDIRTRALLPDRLRWIKFESFAWQGNGFFYSRFDAPVDTAKALSAANEGDRVLYHRVGTTQDEDRLVFEDRSHPKRFHLVSTTDDERFAILTVMDPSTGKRGYEVSVCDRSKGEKEFHPVVTGFDDVAWVADDLGEKLLMWTDRQAPNGRAVLVDPSRPADSSWVDLLPEQTEPLQTLGTGGGRIFAVYMKDVASRVAVYDTVGKRLDEIALPVPGTVWGIGGENEDTTVFYTFTSFTFPSTIYEYNIAARTSTIFRQSEVKFDPLSYATTQVFYTSKDGTRIPMFLVYRKGIVLDGRNPVLMYGYGGFKITIAPSFNPLLVPLLDEGVVYASPNIRGGGEYGEQWHQAGTKLKKQNVFDDFIAAAEWLIAQKYTQPSRLALWGGSNGGLLVGAVMTQRPDLMKVAIPEFGVMDMLRYQKFTLGRAWVADYGTADDSTQFRYFLGYSPLHNIRDAAYPATLVTTADHDDRVVPAHSFKFVATLQEHQQGSNPALIRIDTKSGHGASNTSKRIAETADIFSFLLYNLGVTPHF